MSKVRLTYVITNATSAQVLLRGQLAYMRRQGFEVSLITSPGPGIEAFADQEGIDLHAVPMSREINVREDLIATRRIIQVLKEIQPAIVNSSTPKAGLLGTIAAWFASVPVRVYTLRGLRLETTTGWKRGLLTCTEKIASGLSDRVVCNSNSLRDAYVSLKLASAEKTSVLSIGSGNGIDFDRFKINHQQKRSAPALRKQYDIAPDTVVIGFVGRLTRDKGIVDLVESFERLGSVGKKPYLLLVGDFESGDPLPASVVKRIAASPNISRTGFVTDTAPYYSLFNFLVFPSYREGFPNVPMEAAAAGLPVIGYRATGTVDAVVDDETGVLVSVGDRIELGAAIEKYHDDPQLVAEHGLEGQRRVRKHFRQEVVWEALCENYRELLAKKRMPNPHKMSKAA